MSTLPDDVDFAAIEPVADAVLFEGYRLYPYRKSALKNQRPFFFGTLSPQDSGMSCLMQTQFLLEGDVSTRFSIKVRFLQGGVKREILVPDLALRRLPPDQTSTFGDLKVCIECSSEEPAGNLFRITVRIRNTSVGDGEALQMCSTHTLFHVRQGSFVSLLDTPAQYALVAQQCENVATWPVLAGAEGSRQYLLSSPIILADYPQIAPQSAGHFFDSTEIDEMLSLHLLTLTEDEKDELRNEDPRISEMLYRTEQMSPASLLNLHGSLQAIQPDTPLLPGCRVRLRPKRRADIFDIALDGRVAVVESIEQDLEERVFLSVTLADDPGRDLGEAGQPGHRFFFQPDEVEPV